MMFKFEVAADGTDPLIIRFEPLAWEVTLSPGDTITIEWPETYAGPGGVGTFAHGPGRLTILEPNFLPNQGSWARVWNSDGEEITY